MNEEGILVAHHEEKFVGQNTFKVRAEKNPDLSYEAINQIQRKMMAGKEGTGRYISGWHRGHKGKIEKLIAYTPVHVFDKVWSVAVCAPASVYGIVKSHDGYIMCYSEPGQGTTFKIYFPVLVKTEGIEHVSEYKEVKEIRGGDETILLVDDEESILDIGRGMLEKYGYTTITAESGEGAIEIYERERDRIDLVILDVGMPGMGGHKCLEELLRIDPEIKVIITSGYSPSGKVKETLAAGAAGFIGKPYRLNDMLRKVREVLD